MIRYYGSVLAIGLLTGTLWGCSGETQKAQCGKFNQVTDQVQKIYQPSGPKLEALKKRSASSLDDFKRLAQDYGAAFTELASHGEKSQQLIQPLSVKDEKLLTLKANYLEAHKSVQTNALRLAGISVEQSKFTGADLKGAKFQKLLRESETFSKALEAAGKKDVEVIAQVNAYCNAK